MAYSLHPYVRFCMITAILLLFSFITFSVISQKKPLTNDDIIKMSKKLSENVIITAIETSEARFDTSVDALLNLKDSGVTDKVIEAMQKADANKKNPQTPSNSNNAGAAASPKPTPIASKDSQLFSFKLMKCSISGNIVTCHLQVTNNGQDRLLHLEPGSYGLIDNEANTSPLSYIKVASNDKEYNTFIPSDMTVKAILRYENVSQSASRISRMMFRVRVDPPISSAEVEFRDIPIERG